MARRGAPGRSQLQRGQQPSVSASASRWIAVLAAALLTWGAQGEEGLPEAVGLKAVPLGGEFQVNSYTTGYQIGPVVGVDADGDFVVVWHSYYYDSYDHIIHAQRYASDGTALSSQFQVNSLDTRQFYPAVGVGADGDFVVVWQSFGSSGSDTSLYSIQAQRYASDGSARGGQFQVNTYTSSRQSAPAVGAGADGDFVVVWQSEGSSGSDTSSYSIQAQRYASDGSARGSQFQVNTYTSSQQRALAVDAGADGDFVVVWQSFGSSGSDTSLFSIQAQRYASDGTALSSQFQVNTYTTGAQIHPAVGAGADGDFVVVWMSDSSSGSDTSSHSIQAQRYASDGSALSSQFQVNTYTSDRQFLPAVGVEANGDFVGVWYSYGSSGSDTSSYSIQAQRYASDGSALSSQFQVNTYTYGNQLYPAVGVEADGDFVVAWTSYGSSGSDNDNDKSSIQAQRFLVNPDPSVTLTDGGLSAVPGLSLTYTIVAANRGFLDDPSVTLTSALDPDLSCFYTSAAAGGATGNMDGAGNLAEVLSLPAGSSVTYTVDCTVSCTAAGTLTSTATIEGSLSDSVPGNNIAMDVDTLLAPAADLSVTKDDGLTSVSPSDPVTYTIVAANDGPCDEPSATLTDTFTAELTSCTYASVAGGGATGNTAMGAGDVAETLALPAGSSVTYTVGCTLAGTDPGPPGALSNTVTISGTGSDSNLFDNVASDNDCYVCSGAPLKAMGSISGITRRRRPQGGTKALGDPVEGVTVAIYDVAGIRSGEDVTDALGNFTIEVPAEGCYYVASDAFQDLLPQIYLDHTCEVGDPCDPTTGLLVRACDDTAVAADFLLDEPSAVFSDGFELGDATAWSKQLP